MLAEVAADKVDVNASGFNGRLNTGDNTAQKVAQKLDDLTFPTHSASQIRTSTSGFSGNLNSGDTNVQNALDALDVLDIPLATTAETLTWSPTVSNVIGNQVSVTVSGQRAYRMHKMVFISGSASLVNNGDGNNHISVLQGDISLPVNSVSGITYGAASVSSFSGGHAGHEQPRAWIEGNKLKVKMTLSPAESVSYTLYFAVTYKTP